MGSFARLPGELLIAIAKHLQNESSTQDMCMLFRFAQVNKKTYDYVTSHESLWATALAKHWVYSNAGLHGYSFDLYECHPPRLSATASVSGQLASAQIYLKRRHIDRQVQIKLKELLYAANGRVAMAQAICDDYGTDAADQVYRLNARAKQCYDTEVLYWCDKILKQIAYDLGERLLKEIQARPKLPPWDADLGVCESLDSLCAWSLIHNGRLNEASNQFQGLDDIVCCVRQSWIHSADCADAQSEEQSAISDTIDCLCDALQAWQNVDRVISASSLPELAARGRNMRNSMYDFDYIGQQVLTSAIMSNLGFPSWLVELHSFHEGEPFEEQDSERMYKTAVVSGDVDDDPSKLLYVCYTWHDDYRVTTQPVGVGDLVRLLEPLLGDEYATLDMILEKMHRLHGKDLAAKVTSYKYSAAMCHAYEEGYQDLETIREFLPLEKLLFLTHQSKLSGGISFFDSDTILLQIGRLEILSTKPWLNKLSGHESFINHDMEQSLSDAFVDSAAAKACTEGAGPTEGDSHRDIITTWSESCHQRWDRWNSAVRYVAQGSRALPRYSCGTIVSRRSNRGHSEPSVIYGFNDACSADWQRGPASISSPPNEPYYSTYAMGWHSYIAESDIVVLSCVRCGDRSAAKDAKCLTSSPDTKQLEEWIRASARYQEEEGLRWLFRQAKNQGLCGFLPARSLCNPRTSTYWPSPPRACKSDKLPALERYDRFIFGDLAQ